MEKPIIVIKLTYKQYPEVVRLAQTVFLSMTGNVNYPTPAPTLTTLNTATTAVINSIAKWGPKGNRGSHANLVNLQTQSKYLLTLLTQLSEYCMNTVDPLTTLEEQMVFLSTSGFPLKNGGSPQGILQAVQNYHQFISRQVSAGQVKLKWKKPQNVTAKGNVKNYKVYRNSVNNFATATLIDSVGPTSYSEYPPAGTWYYWIVATNNVGNGVVSNALSVTVAVAS